MKNLKQAIPCALVTGLLVSNLAIIPANALSNVRETQINLSNSFTTDVILANDAMHSDENAKTMIDSDVTYAINGGFFNSYYNSSAAISFPNNSPRIYGAMIKDGHLINAGGDNNMIGFTYDDKVLMDKVKCTPAFAINGERVVTTWAINQVYSDPNAITIVTDDFNMSFATNPSSQVFTVTNGSVSDISSATSHTVADGSFKIIYNSGAIENANKWDLLPKFDDSIELTSSYESKDGDDWNNVKTGISGGRMLVKDSVNVSSDTSYNAQFDNDPKQSNTSSALRSYVGFKADNTMIFGTASGTFSEIANKLISNGVHQAISLDGGASSMLYSKDAGYITSAGRELASILVLTTDDGTEVKPDKPIVVPPPPTASSNTPSDWAVQPINQATNLGLIPAWLQYSYQSPITRQEFCVLLTTFIQEFTGISVDEYRNTLKIDYNDFTFTDTDDYYVRSIAALGIVSGTGNGEFSPKDPLTREQSATMMSNLITLIGVLDHEVNSSSSMTPVFTDENNISGWAKDAVSRVTTAKIMNGKGETFDPQGIYTREQAYITMLNAFQKIQSN